MGTFCLFFNRLVKTGLCICFGIAMLSSHAQTREIDSLKLQLKQEMPDTSRVRLLLRLSSRSKAMDIEQALTYIREARSLAQEISYTKGAFNAELQMAMVYYTDLNQDSAVPHFSKAIEIAKSNGYVAELSAAYNNMSVMYFFFREPDTAIALQKRALDLRIELGDIQEQIHRYNNIAAMYGSLSDYINALKYLFKAREMSLESGKQEGLLRIYSNIGKTYLLMGDHDKSMQYFKEALNSTPADENYMLDFIKNNMGEIWLKTGQPEKAIAIYREILSQTEGPGSGPCEIAAGQAGIAKAFFALGQLDSTLAYGNEGLKGLEECQYKEYQVQALVTLGKTNTALGNYALAEKQLLESTQIISSEVSLLSAGYLALSRLYEKQGRFEKALDYLQRHKSQQDSVFNDENTKLLARAEMEHEFAAEKTLIQAQQENERLRLTQKIEGTKRTRNYFIIGLLVFIVLAYILFVSNRRKRADNQILAEKNRTILNQQEELVAKADLLRTSNERINELSEFKERLAHMAVHDMKNPLNVLIGLSAGEVTPKKMRIIRRAGLQALNFVTNMLDIYKFEQAHIALDLKAYYVQQLVDDAEEEVESLLLEKNISLVKVVDPDLKGAFDGIIMIRILVNLLTNAIKYSDFDSNIYIEAKAEKETETVQWLKLVIKDEGAGIAPELLSQIFEEFNNKKAQHITKSTSTGIGLNFCKLAVKAHKGTIHAKSEVGEGTHIYIRLPLFQTPIELESHDKPVKRKKEAHLILEEEEHEIKEYAQRLRTFKIYEVSKINAILREMEDDGIKSPWKEKLQGTVYASNQQAFETLLSLVENET